MTFLELLPSITAGVAAASIVLLDRRRSVLLALAALYLAVAWQLSQTVALPIGLAEGVVGVAVVAIMLRRPAAPSTADPGRTGLVPTSRGFHVAAILLVLIPASGLVGLGILAALPLTLASRLGCVWVMALGALLVGLSEEIEKRTLGHLVLLCGFALLYVPLEPSVLVTVLLCSVHLGLALIGSYLITLQGTRREA